MLMVTTGRLSIILHLVWWIVLMLTTVKLYQSTLGIMDCVVSDYCQILSIILLWWVVLMVNTIQTVYHSTLGMTDCVDDDYCQTLSIILHFVWWIVLMMTTVRFCLSFYTWYNGLCWWWPLFRLCLLFLHLVCLMLMVTTILIWPPLLTEFINISSNSRHPHYQSTPPCCSVYSVRVLTLHLDSSGRGNERKRV